MLIKLLVITLFLIFSAPANTEIFKYVDEEGVVSFTDDVSTIPETLRSQVEKIASMPESVLDMEALEKTKKKILDLPKKINLRERFLGWTSHPYAQYLAAFAPLAGLAVFLFFIQRRIKSLFVRLVFKGLCVLFLGIAFYSVVIMNKIYPVSLPFQEMDIPSMENFDPLHPIQSFENQVEGIEKNLKGQEEVLTTILSED